MFAHNLDSLQFFTIWNYIANLKKKIKYKYNI